MRNQHREQALRHIPEFNQAHRRRVSDPDTSAESLLDLAASRDVVVRRSLISHANATSRLAELLYADYDEVVRLSVATSPLVDSSVLTEIAYQDRSWLVRLHATQNPNSQLETFSHLLNTIPLNLATLSCQPGLDSATIDALADQDEIWIERIPQNLACQPNASPRALEKLSRHPLVKVRVLVAAHSNTDEGVRKALREDRSGEVRNQAARATVVSHN